LSQRTFCGHIDRIDQNGIAGWAVETNAPDIPAKLSVYINGARVATVSCGEIRPDAVAAGFPGGRQFNYRIEQGLQLGRNLIEVGFDETNLLVPNGKGEITVSKDGQIGDHWSAQYNNKPTKLVTEWWESDYIVRRINHRICGKYLSGVSAGLHQRALDQFGERVPFSRGVSIGCGIAYKERAAIQCGLVEHFTLFELSSVAIERGRQAAADAGLSDQMDFRLEDGFTSETREEVYDLVYWNNSLHHMLDVKAALEWSWRVLKKGGVLLMDDFVGPTLMQWSDKLMQINTTVRQSLPPKYLHHPTQPGYMFPAVVTRLDPQAIQASDPSECADSSNILPELRRLFPGAWIQNTGGGIYLLGLNGVQHNILAAQDFALLEQLLELDDLCAAHGETAYAVAIAVK